MVTKRGSNRHNTLNGTNGNDSLFGLGGDDMLRGKGGNDRLDGGTGNDTLDGGKGADKMKGGDGNDTYIVDNAGDRVTESTGQGTDIVKSSVTHTLSANVENLILTGAAAINGSGNTGANVLTGNAAANVFAGEGGNDTYIGGGGFDIVSYAPASSRVEVYAYSAAPPPNAGDALGDTLNSIEGLIGSAFDDYLALDFANPLGGFADGGTGNDQIDGTEFSDTLIGGAGHDKLFGLEQHDSLTGGDGDDELYGNTGDDTLDGGNNNDQLFGGSNADSLTGGAGNDTLDGGTGADMMSGGDGSDVYFADDASDTVSENLNEGGSDEVRTTLATYVLPSNVEVLNFIGAGNFTGTGNGLVNGIGGSAGDDTLSGGGGADRIYGAGGQDTLNGGSEADTFLFISVSDSAPGARDIIADFSQADADKIDLSLTDANNVSVGDQSFFFIGNLTFTGGVHSPDGEVRYFYDNLNDWTVIEVNLDDGGATADMAIRLVGNITLTAADFNL